MAGGAVLVIIALIAILSSGSTAPPDQIPKPKRQPVERSNEPFDLIEFSAESLPLLSSLSTSACGGSEVAAPPQLPFKTHRFRKGDVYRFRGQFAVSLRYDMSALTRGFALGADPLGEVSWVQYHLQSLIEFKVKRIEPELVVSGRLVNPFVVIFSGANPEENHDTREVRDELAFPFELEGDSTGQFRLFRTKPGIPPMLRNFVSSIVQEFNFVVPQSPTAGSWESNERESSGVFVYCYTTLDPDPTSALRVQKEKTGELEFKMKSDGEETTAPADCRVTGGRVATFDERGGFFKSLVINESFDITGYQNGIHLQMQVAGQVERIDAEDGPEALAFETGDVADASGPWKESRFGVASATTENRRKFRELHEREAIEGLTFEELLADLNRIEADGNFGSVEGVQLTTKIALMVRYGRADRDVLLDAMLNKGLSPAAQSILMGSIGKAGTDVAFATLQEVLGRTDFTEDVRQHTAYAFLSGGVPPKEVVSTLQAVSERGSSKVSSASLMVLGAMAGRLAPTEPAAADEAVAYLEERLRAASTTKQQVPLIAALGNAALERSLDTLIHYAETGEEIPRAKAVFGLRLYSGSAIDDRLVQYARQDDSAMVRKAAVMALGSRKAPRSMEAFDRVLENDSDTRVRQEVISQLAQWRKPDPRVFELLGRAASGDPADSLRKYAAQALEGLNQNSKK